MDSIRAIHQFHHGVDSGDGVTNSMLFIRRLLRSLGFNSEIFAVNTPARMRSEVKPFQALEKVSVSETLLLHHHSLGHDLEDWLASLKIARTLVYHNITPAEFFPEGSDYYHYARLGREQLARWRDQFKASLAVSAYNAHELESLGYTNVTTLPLLVDSERMVCDPLPAGALQKKLPYKLRHRPVLAFVGRLVENKRQHLLLEMLWHLRHLCRSLPDVSPPVLILAGGGEKDAYARALRQRVHQLQLDDSVLIAGKVPDETLLAIYQQADAFVCASAHEGFGMPLVEAMYGGCPVVAMATSNIPDTLGEGGLLLDTEEPAVMAATLSLLLEDSALRSQVVEGQNRALSRYEYSVLRQKFAGWLQDTLGIVIPHDSRSAHSAMETNR